MKNLLFLLFTLISFNIFAQTKEQKIADILKTSGTIEGYKSFLFDITIAPFKSNVDKKDSLKLIAIENKLTDEEIEIRISKAYSKFFSNKEIDEIYTYYKSSAGKKMINSYENLQKIINENFQDIQNELQPIIEKFKAEQEKEAENNKEKPISANKEDGLYFVINENRENNELKNLKLHTKPAILIDEILEIKNSKDQLGRNVIDIILKKEGAKNFKILTENNIGKPIAVVLNNKLISAPIVNDVIPNGRIQISGNFSDEEVNEIISGFKK